jgi:hypothetical protein
VYTDARILLLERFRFMKIISTAFSLFLFPVLAQQHFIEYQIGASASAVISPDPLHQDVLLTFAYGAAYRLELEKFSFSASLGWQPKGYAYEVVFSDNQGNSLGGNTFRKEKMNYLNSEFLVLKTLGERHGFVFGAGFSLSKYLYSKVLLPPSQLNNGALQPGFVSKNRNLEPWDFGLIGRIGYTRRFSERCYFFFIVDYYHELAKINYSINPNNQPWTNRAVLLRVGHGFALGGQKGADK